MKPASPKRPTTNALRVSGVEVRTGNYHGGAEKLTKGMSEVDILNDAASRRKETEIQLLRNVPAILGHPPSMSEKTIDSAPRVALVTGAAQGIGKAIALRLAEDGLDVAVLDLPQKRDQLEAVVEAIKAKGRGTVALYVDVSSEPEIEAAIQGTVDRLGGLDVIVANAAICEVMPIVDLTVESFDKTVAVNARGVMLAIKHAARHMIAQGRGGRIIASFPDDEANGGHGTTLRKHFEIPPDIKPATPDVVASFVSYIAKPESRYITVSMLQKVQSGVQHLTEQVIVALVTGAAQGIGEAIALRLADNGLDVALVDLPTKRSQLDSVAQAIRAKGQRAIIVHADVSQEAAVEGMVTEAVAQLGGLDVMVANAGICEWSPIVDLTVESWDATMSVNARGVMLAIKHAARQMVAQKRGGRIIAQELRVHNITVNGYCPGAILTPLTLHPDDVINGGHGSTKSKIVGIPSDIKPAPPEVIASFVSYLAKPESRYITGQSVNIDGGWKMD
ncbi:hypothetical protein ACG7TL_002447 [Trametes sanguinea]